MFVSLFVYVYVISDVCVRFIHCSILVMMVLVYCYQDIHLQFSHNKICNVVRRNNFIMMILLSSSLHAFSFSMAYLEETSPHGESRGILKSFLQTELQQSNHNSLHFCVSVHWNQWSIQETMTNIKKFQSDFTKFILF